jgi:hypothetical protein
VAAEEALIAKGEAAAVAGDDYLDVGDVIGDLALTYDWCRDLLTPEQAQRWRAYADQAVWNVWHPDEAAWGGKSFPWSGWSIDNPVNNYYFSFLRATMLLGLATEGEDAQAADWITMFRTTKIGDELVPVYTTDLVGGGSREGTGYGTAMRDLFRLYDMWYQATGERIDTLTGHARASLPYLLHSIVPTRDRFAPIGDQARDSTASLFDYHRDYLQVLMTLYPTDPVAEIARGFLPLSSVPEMSQPFMRYSDFLYDGTGLPTRPLADLYPLYHAAGTGTVFVRSGWGTGDTWAAFTAGPFTESHAHHDQGQLLVYRNEWLAYDSNVDSHSGIRQEEECHNLVRIEYGGKTVEMRTGAPDADLQSLADNASYSYMAADITPIYDGQAPIESVQRGVVFLKPDIFVVVDRVRTSDPLATRVFQLNTPIQPVAGAGVVTMAGAKGRLDLYPILPDFGGPQILAWPDLDPDFNGGFRIDIAQADVTTAVYLNVLGLDGAVASAVSSPDGARIGVALVRADGRKATVRFAADGPGGTIELRSAADQIELSEDLPQTVASFPLLAN